MHLDLNILTKKRNKTKTVTKKKQKKQTQNHLLSLASRESNTNGTMLQSEVN